jgi:hypothetical protein
VVVLILSPSALQPRPSKGGMERLFQNPKPATTPQIPLPKS